MKRKNVLHHPVIEHHRAYFQAVRHAHGVAVAQQPRFQVCGEIDESDSLHYVVALDLPGPFANTVGGFEDRRRGARQGFKSSHTSVSRNCMRTANCAATNGSSAPNKYRSLRQRNGNDLWSEECPASDLRNRPQPTRDV